MSWLSKLFGGGEAAAPAAVASTEYKGFRVMPQPIKADGGYRICAVIEGEVHGEAKSHTLIRADVLRDPDDAVEASVNKAKQLIDQQGLRLFE